MTQKRKILSKTIMRQTLKQSAAWALNSTISLLRFSGKTAFQAGKGSLKISRWALNKGVSPALKFFIRKTEPSVNRLYKNKLIKNSTNVLNAFTFVVGVALTAQNAPDLDDLTNISTLKQSFSNAVSNLITPKKSLKTNLTRPQEIIRYVMLDLEGGAKPFHEGGGHYSVYGINSKYVFKKHEQENMTKKGIDWKKKSLNFVYNLNKNTAYEYYKERYWDQYDVGSLTPEMRLLAFDAYVQHGSSAKPLVKKANNSADKLLRLRRQHYASLVKNNPTRNKKYESGWNNRLNKVESKYKKITLTTPLSTPNTVSVGCGEISTQKSVQYVAMDAKTGKIICSKRGDVRAHPASLTKAMALAVVFDAIDKGVIALNDNVKITQNVIDRTKGLAQCGKIKNGQRLKVKDLITAAGTRSDAISIVALARHTIAKSNPDVLPQKREGEFLKLMNKKAKAYGMQNSNFSVITGRTHSNNKSTPNDIARLFKGLYDEHPKHMKTAMGQKNASNISHMCGSTKHTSRLVNGWYGDSYKINGGKTGLTAAAGFNQAIHFNSGVITVVFGARGDRNTGRLERTEATKNLYEHAQQSVNLSF